LTHVVLVCCTCAYHTIPELSTQHAWLYQRLLALTVGCEIGIYDSLAPQFCRLFCGAMARVMILLGYSDQT
jgi:hypothetical protein